MPAPRPFKILLVDDDANLHQLVRDAFEATDLELISAFDGEQGLRKAAADDPDVVLLDRHMPKLDGIAVLRRLREGGAHPDLPVIFLTQNAELESKLAALGLGAEDYLTKPLAISELEARVRAHARTKRAREELRESNLKLRELEWMRDTLTGYVVHDLQNLCQAVHMGQSLVLEGLDSMAESKKREFLGVGIAAARRLQEMIQDLSDIRRLERREMEIEAVDISAAELLDRTRDLIGPLAKTLKTEFTCLHPHAELTVRADPRLLRRVLGNLSANAMKFADTRSPAVKLGAAAPPGGGRAVFTVEHNGPCLQPEELPRIFDRFYRVQNDPRNALAGTGVGLTFCRLAVEAQDGAIWAENLPGAGGRFFVAMPAKA